MQPFLSIGGDYNTFWKLTPKKIKVFFKAYASRMQEGVKMAWLQGTYFKQALASTVIVAGLADKRVVSQMPEYPQMPEFEEENNLNISNEERDKIARDKVLMQMEKWMNLNNNR